MECFIIGVVSGVVFTGACFGVGYLLLRILIEEEMEE
jgi:hypothetical protein